MIHCFSDRVPAAVVTILDIRTGRYEELGRVTRISFKTEVCFETPEATVARERGPVSWMARVLADLAPRPEPFQICTTGSFARGSA